MNCNVLPTFWLHLCSSLTPLLQTQLMATVPTSLLAWLIYQHTLCWVCAPPPCSSTALQLRAQAAQRLATTVEEDASNHEFFDEVIVARCTFMYSFVTVSRCVWCSLVQFIVVIAMVAAEMHQECTNRGGDMRWRVLP
jgi:hypothetical protein